MPLLRPAYSGERVKMIFPLKDGTEWTLPEEKRQQWRDHYKTKNVDFEIGEARQWLLDNPKRQKKKAGMTRFLSGWIKRSPDVRTESTIAETKIADDRDLERMLR